ncbi:hypothetical protein ABS71_11815 [bacterium SCN 62-11]|nr:MAG: hypothetical protein ABS71_11815 [bacterium SCN 62-11]
MEEHYCWPCREVVPMVDETEYEELHRLFDECTHSVKEGGLDPDEGFKPLREAYSRLTGAKETHHDHLLEHRITAIGPPCTACGKPLRTPEAKLCAACGQFRLAARR